MSFDHEEQRRRIKDYSFKSGHDVVYHDGGAERKTSSNATNAMMKRTNNMRVISPTEKMIGKA